MSVVIGAPARDAYGEDVTRANRCHWLAAAAFGTRTAGPFVRMPARDQPAGRVTEDAREHTTWPGTVQSQEGS